VKFCDGGESKNDDPPLSSFLHISQSDCIEKNPTRAKKIDLKLN